ncbi:UDP-2,3-diacylglucosamine diphosphatase [Salinisphaera sp.]|uniref:UDP-2,3-diacylglucosamine diphosphatase n=1 Tax=Salinisphaera sp. TaxID=1914330 RepID=UPI002D79A3AB|nr:UDP-2,3-diacylglucosamine diphosphatase [Salinisphaera sp.]HET7314538.1 UDP-2,3-diacylglucosamine diphosphatase [Salinisphaera sp.]
MSATHFIADLHLVDDHAPAARRLAGYLAGPARDADALYVLGDLFDVWIGDDGSTARHAATLDAFRALADTGVPIYFMRGNRDFAVGPTFEARSRLRIIDDPTVLTLYGVPTLLAHGDVFCSDDVAHQLFRAKYTDARWRERRLALPLWLRRVVARRARRRSAAAKTTKPAYIMDVNRTTVAAMAAEYDVARIIHGHTHRPADHDDGIARHVLADWRPDRAEVLVVDRNGIRRAPLGAGGGFA